MHAVNCLKLPLHAFTLTTCSFEGRSCSMCTCQDERALPSMLYHPLKAESLVQDDTLQQFNQCITI